MNPFGSDGLFFEYLRTLYYPNLLQDPTFRGYVAQVNGEIVSFAARFLDIEEGICFYASARTKEHFRCQGIFQKLVEVMHIDMIIPDGKKVAFVSVYSEDPKIHRETYWRQPGHLLIDRVAYLIYLIPYESIIKLTEMGRTSGQVKSIKVEDLRPGHI